MKRGLSPYRLSGLSSQCRFLFFFNSPSAARVAFCVPSLKRIHVIGKSGENFPMHCSAGSSLRNFFQEMGRMAFWWTALGFNFCLKVHHFALNTGGISPASGYLMVRMNGKIERWVFKCLVSKRTKRQCHSQSVRRRLITSMRCQF